MHKGKSNHECTKQFRAAWPMAPVTAKSEAALLATVCYVCVCSQNNMSAKRAAVL